MSVVSALQEWYKSQYNEDWEHRHGLKIDTLDNSGWAVEIDLTVTNLEDKLFPQIRNTWSRNKTGLSAGLKMGKFRGVGGPEKLEAVLEHLG